MRILYKVGTIILFVFVFLNFRTVNAQYSYSIDIKAKKSRSVPLKFALTQARETLKLNTEHRKKKRIALKNSKKIRKHTYSIQTKKVKRRMRKASKKAENYNKGKVPMVVKLKNMLNG